MHKQLRALLNVKPLRANEVRSEITGGFVGSLISLPQSIGLGIIAFAPLGKEYLGVGIFAAVMSSIIIAAMSAFFGGSQGIISGVRASVIIIFASVLTKLLASDIFVPGLTGNTHLILLLAFLVLFAAGALQIALGAFRLGRVVESMPQAILAGFINAAALIIIIGQVKSILAIPGDVSLFAILDYIGPDSMAPIGLAAVTVGAIVLGEKFLPRIPGILSGGVVGVLAYYLVLGSGVNIDLGGTIPQISFSDISLEPLSNFFGFAASSTSALIHGSDVIEWGQFVIKTDALPTLFAILIPAIITVAVLQSLDTLFTIVSWDEMTQQRSNANRELVVEGLGTLVCSSLGLLSSAGSMARTRASYRAGGKTAWAVIFSSAFLMIMVFALAPFVQLIPKVVVSAVLFIIAYDLFDRWSLALVKKFVLGSWASRKVISTDLFNISLVIVIALTIGFIEAVGAGLCVAILEFLLRMSRSPIRRVLHGNLLHSHLQRDEHAQNLLSRFGSAIVILELEGSFFFGSAKKIEHKVDGLIAQGARHVILDLKRVKDIDSTAVRTLARLYRRMAQLGGSLSISYVHRERRTRNSDQNGEERRRNASNRNNWCKFDQFDGLTSIGEDNFFDDTDSALRVCETRLLLEKAVNERLVEFRGAEWPAILQGLGREQVKGIRALAERRLYPTGSEVFCQGGQGDSVFFLTRGKMDVTLYVNNSGRKIRVSTLSPGSVFGEMAYLDPMPRSATITAVEDCVCYSLTAAQLARLVSDEPRIAITLFKNMNLIFTKRLRAANLAIMELES